MELSEQLFALAGDCLDDPLRVIGAKVAQIEEVIRRAELDVRVNLNPLFERMNMHPFTLLEKDLQKALEIINET